MLNATQTRFMQTMIKGIAIFILFFAPLHSYSQSNDLCRVTIESVKCVKPSTGQDAYTAFLFKGIEIAIKAGAAMATGGSSLTATAALEIAKEAAKKTVKAGIQIAATNQAKNIFAANKEQILALANMGGDGSGQPSNLAKTAGVAMEIYQLTTLQGMFNKLYGESPDDLYIKLNGAKVWPSGQSVSIKSQQTFPVNASAIFERTKGFSIQLIEYDYGSNDDDLGIVSFEVPPSFMGEDRVVDQVFYHKEEGSFYMVTFKVESLLRHRFINDIVGSLWDQTVNGGTSSFAFGGGTIVGGENGITWKIIDADKINYCINDRPYMTVTFTSENTAIGTYIQQNQSGNQISYTAKRRSLDHRSAKNLVGSSWDFYSSPGQAPVIMEFGSGTINYPQLNSPGITWKFLAADFVAITSQDKAREMRIFFDSENTFNGKGWGGQLQVSGKRRAGTSQQQQQQQTTLQHRFINNIVGTSWNYSEAGGGTYTFSIGQNTIDNFSYPGVGWEGATWKVIGNDKIQLMATNGALMDLTFNSPNSFIGYSWNNNIIVVNGTNRQVQQQQQQQQQQLSQFQHRYINNIIGSTWNYTEPGNPTNTFSFGNGTITNFSIPGTFWDAVTWKVIGNDKIQLIATNGAIMDITFYDQNNFHGYYWNDNVNIVNGSIRQAQGQQQQSQFQHQFINNLTGTSWYYTEPGNGTFSFTIGQGTITNFSTPGTYWDGVTWTISGKDQIQLRTTTGNTMDLFFSDKNNFSGYYWNNGTTIISGTNMQPQN